MKQGRKLSKLYCLDPDAEFWVNSNMRPPGYGERKLLRFDCPDFDIKLWLKGKNGGQKRIDSRH